MDTEVLTAHTLFVINRIFESIIGYGDDRRLNFNTKITKTGGDVTIQLDYIDTGKLLFKGLFKEENLIESYKNEIAKEKVTNVSE